MSEGLGKGPYLAARVGFEHTTLRTQGAELTTELLDPTWPEMTSNDMVENDMTEYDKTENDMTSSDMV